MYNQAVLYKNTSLILLASVGGAIFQLFGGWDALLKTLIICMAVDYITGVLVAALGKSNKSESGKITSLAAVSGIIKKGVILLIILVVAQLEIGTGTDFIRDSVILFFIGSEGISIVENAGLLGVPMPTVLTQWFEVLRKKGDKDDKDDPRN